MPTIYIGKDNAWIATEHGEPGDEKPKDIVRIIGEGGNVWGMLTY